MFEATFGLLLRDDLHHAFDRLELSFYHSVGLCRTRRSRSLIWCREM